MKKLKRIIIIALLVFLGVMGYRYYKNHYSVSATTLTVTENDYLETLKSKDSEIPGMTKYDKLMAGLNPDSDDTDNDGLTDNDELNKYNSDPTKKSTAGDFYSDKYKVDNGMDVNTWYEYNEEIKYQWNECPEVILNAECLDDTYAVVEDTNISEEAGVQIFKKYRVYNYGNTLSIDVSDILSSYQLSEDNLGIFLYRTGGSPEAASYKIVDGVAQLKDKLNKNAIYYVYVVNKNDEKNSKIAEQIEDINNAIIGAVVDQSYSLVVIKPLYSFLAGWIFDTDAGVQMYYVDCGSEWINTSNITEMCDAVNFMISSEGRFNINSECIKCVTFEEYKELLEKAEKRDLFIDHHFRGSIVNQPFDQYVTWCYFSADDMGDLDYSNFKEEKRVAIEYGGVFNLQDETLSFGNFATDIAPNGVCMGVATLTAKVHNDKGMTPTGELYVDDTFGNVKWDLSTDSENTTLTDMGLNDYKDSDFVSKRSDSHVKVTAKSDGEQQFLNMVSCYWKEGNDLVKKNCNYMYPGITNYPLSNINEVTRFMDDGKIVICGMGADNGKSQGAHAVVLYAYERLESGEIVFSVYDNNYPNLESKDLRLVIYPKKSSYGYSDTFDYVYETPQYSFDSATSSKYFLIFMDEDHQTFGVNS